MSVTNRAEADAALDAYKDRPLGDIDNQRKPVLLGGENTPYLVTKMIQPRGSMPLLIVI